MAEEFVIKSPAIEDKINQLLPSQGGFQPGVDFSASTMVIPIVDLTETAEGSSLRVDLQSAISHNQANVFSVTNAKTTVINTTGYWRLIGAAGVNNDATTGGECNIIINDGTTDKIVWGLKNTVALTNNLPSLNVDYIFFLGAGDSLIVESDNTESHFVGSIRQLADLSGNLISPT